MKKHSLLGSLIFGLLIFGFVQNVPLASAAQGDIGTIIENLEFDTSSGTSPDIIQVKDDTFAVVYVGRGGESDSDNGILRAFTLNDAGNLSLKATVTFDAGTVTNPKILHITGSEYLIIYESGGNIRAAVWNISNDGNTLNETTNEATIFSTGVDPDVVRLSGTTGGDQFYAVAFEGATDTGFVDTIKVTSAGVITSPGSATSYASESADVEILKVGDQKYAVAFRDNGGIGHVETLTIQDDGTGITANIGNLGANLNSPNTISSSSDLDFHHVTGTVYAVAWSDGTDGKIETLAISADGTTITSTSIGASFGANVVDPVLLQTDLSSSPFPFLVAYHDSTGGDINGIVKSFVITNGGVVGDIIDTLIFDTFNGQTPSLAHRTGDFYAVAYEGNGVDGFVSSFSIGTADNTAPDITGALTINETGDTNEDDFSDSGEVIVLTFTTTEQIQIPTVTFTNLAGGVTIANTGGNTWTATVTVAGGDNGLVTFTINFDDLSGNSSTQKTQANITDGSSVTTDTIAPTLIDAVISGTDSFTIVYSEPVFTTTSDYTIDDFTPGGSATVETVSGSGTATILVDTDNSGGSGSSTIQFDIAVSLLDRAENPISAVSDQIINTAFVEPDLTSANNIVLLSDNTLVTTITATAVDPDLNLAGLASSGANTAVFPSSAITVTTSSSSVQFPASVTASNLPADEVIEVFTSTKTATNLPSGETAGIIVEFGDPDQDIGFSSSVKVVLSGQGGKTPFIINAAGVTELVSTCLAEYATSAAADASADIATGTPFTDECAFTSGSNLIFWTEHFSGFGGSSPISSGGGGGGDSTPPSITVGFEQNEFPLRYDGVNYQSHQLDSAHTALIKTGEELKATLTLYDNSGAASIQHVELYVHQFGSRILNDLSETIVIYDGQSGLEIIDPYDLIATANVIPSISGNKAVFDFVVVFENEFPTSDVLFRIWDIKRNSVQLHLPDALKVEISEQSSNIISVIPESEVSDTEPESESIVPEATPEVPGAAPEVPEATPEVPEATPEVPGAAPGISEPTPEVVLHPKTWTSGQLSVLKQWGGYDTETASDLDVLAKFGIKGEKIPSYVKQFVKWILEDQISQEEFVNALQYFKREGILSNSVDKKSFTVNSQKELEKFTLMKDIDNKIQFDPSEKENSLYTKANLNYLEEKIRILRSLANNVEIQNELVNSNSEFETLEDLDILITQRDSEWQRNPKTVTPFMESLLNNESALIAKAIIEHDKEDLVPLISIVITNAYGANIAITEKTPDYLQSDEQWWNDTKENGINIMSGAGSEEQTGLYTIEISTSIYDLEGNFIGIINAVVNFEKVLLSD